jgi:tetratricopeptide (TPR) repeat protein
MARKEDALDRGIRFFEEGNLREAEACLTQVEGDPARLGQAQVALGQVYLKARRPADAERALRKALAFHRTTKTFLLLGESLMQQNKLQRAEETFQAAAGRDAANPETWIMLGHSQAAQQRLQEAIRSYEQALIRDGQSLSARYHLAETLVKLGDLQRAATQLHYLRQREPNYIPAILLVGNMAYFRQDYRQAIVEYCRALEIEKVDALILERLGHAFNAISDFAQALKAFETSIQEHPTHWPCFLEAARLAEGNRALRKAKRYYQAIAHLPDYQAEASEAIARIDAHFAQFDLSEPSNDPAPLDPGFTPPETLERGTAPLDPESVPWAGATATGKLDGWVSTKTGKLDKPSPAAPAPEEPPVHKLIPQGLKNLFKRPDR